MFTSYLVGMRTCGSPPTSATTRTGSGAGRNAKLSENSGRWDGTIGDGIGVEGRGGEGRASATAAAARDSESPAAAWHASAAPAIPARPPAIVRERATEGVSSCEGSATDGSAGRATPLRGRVERPLVEGGMTRLLPPPLVAGQGGTTAQKSAKVCRAVGDVVAGSGEAEWQ